MFNWLREAGETMSLKADDKPDYQPGQNPDNQPELNQIQLEHKLRLLPDQPGVYLMKAEGGSVIYVGKAISLKNRVRSYFQNSAALADKVRAMVAKIVDLEYIITDTELEALILECNLIKRYRPNYNIRLRDDKGYPYLKVTVGEEYPRVIITRSIRKDGAKYYGPYTSSGAVQETLRLLQKLFSLKLCSRQSLAANTRPCLNYHIKRCLAPCTGQVSKEHYANLVKEVCLFIEGKHDALLKVMEQQMQQAAEQLQFERAAEIRDQIKALGKIAERQKIDSSDLTDQDVIALARGFDEVCVMVFYIRSGKLLGREPHFLQGTDHLSESEVLIAFVKQYYNQVEFIPPEILVEQAIEEEEVITQWLKQKRGGKVTVHAPQRGTKKAFVEMAAKNALQELEQHQAQLQQEQAMTEGAVMELQEYLHLAVPPWRMECYDISNTQGTESVGSMVVFVGGKPCNQDYRRFKIKTVEGSNDFASMQEVLGRRFKRAAKLRDAKELQAKEPQVTELQATEALESQQADQWSLPDLIIIDGGKGQLGAAREIMLELGFDDIPTYGLAKQEEHLFTEGQADPIILPRSSKALYLIQRLRDEAHRFALAYHRNLRSKRNLHSLLEDIPGIGSKRKQALYKHFGALAKIRTASVEQLTNAPGMTKKAAQEVWEFFQSELSK
jgi:excinuclease ABC subunit C